MSRWLRGAVTVLVAVAFATGVAAQHATAQDLVDAAPPLVVGPPGVAMAEPVAGAKVSQPIANANAAPINASYSHSPAPNSGNDLPPGNGQVMTSTTIYFDYWLPTGDHFESNAAGDTNYETLLNRFAQDLNGSQYHNLVTQYSGTNGTITNNVTFGGSTVRTNAYPHTGTTGDPLGDADIQAEVTAVAAQQGWTQDVNHIIAVFTANGIHECMAGGSPCTFSSSNGFCAYHDHYSNGGNDAVYAFMGFDNFTHAAGKTCVAGQTASDSDPNRGNYPNSDTSADAEISTFSHELIEAETDPHPNDTWTGPLGEIGDACNFTFTPRADNGADIYLNGHPYIVQEEWSNAVHTCATDLPTNGFCAGSVSQVCSPSTQFGKSVDDATPPVNSTIHYTLSLNNTNDTGVETNLSVTDSVPAGITITNVSAPSSTSSSFNSSSLTVGYDYLSVHQTRTITVTATVPLNAGAVLTNCGGLAGQDLLGTALSAATTNPCATTTVAKGMTSTALTSSVNPSVFAQSVTFTATVSGSSTPTGTVTFTDGVTVLGSPTLSGGVASLTTSTLAVGTHTITATYNGDGNFLTSSDSLQQVVNKQPTTTTVSCVPNPAHVNQLVTCTATVSQTIVNPTPVTGTVTFFSDGVPIATVPVSGGQAVLPTTFGGGSHSVVAVYNGDGNYLGSTSSTFTETIICDVTITGTHSSLVVTSGTTCVLNAHITGGISVAKGAVLDVENSVVSGSISAYAPSAFRECGSSTGTVAVSKATGFVLIGDPTHNCAANLINGSINASYNTGGLVIVGNTVVSTVTTVGNSGTSPLGQPVTVSGNHH